MARRSAFTLIELLVVVALLAILAAILFPVFSAARDKARSATCQSNLRQLAAGIKLYSQDNDEQGVQYWWTLGPSGTRLTWMEEVDPYVKSAAVYLCPSAPTDPLAYTTTCKAQPAHVSSTYCLPTQLFYNLWGINGVVMFAGFPSGIDPATGTTDCRQAFQVCEPSPERADSPADAALLIEGFVVSYEPTAQARFGPACASNFSTIPSNHTIHRHAEGMNAAFCDGHVKYFPAARFWRDSSAVTQTVGFAGRARSPFMEVGP